MDVILTKLRQSTGRDFSLYRQEVLRRPLERRMALAGIATTDIARYVRLLNENPLELQRLAADLSTNVTHFFRDPEVFERLRSTVVPQLLKRHPPDRTLRLWVAGCSTGEEAYSLAMILQECIWEAGSDVWMEVFASDADEEAIAFGSEGFYPDAIRAHVSPGRLGRFFHAEQDGYRVIPELRSCVVFAVQDVLADPPFRNIDFVSCRNLLIHLTQEAQAKVIGLFHFALNDNGILMLGATETIATSDSRFNMFDEAAKIYRRDWLQPAPSDDDDDLSPTGFSEAVLPAELADRPQSGAAIRGLERAAEEQKPLNAEVNETLLTAQQELQSLNEQLIALKIQLQDVSERRQATANDLEKLLHSTDLAVILLDARLNIRYFTPAARSIFNILTGDIGRPLADLNARAPDASLLGDAAAAIEGSGSQEREIRTADGIWYLRRLMPYRSQTGATEGVVITFADVTVQRSEIEMLERAKRAAERANAAKTRFLAAASHDLRQPLQSLLLLQGLLEKSVSDEKAQKLVRGFRDTLGSMSRMLNGFLDIHQIEAGTLHPRIVTCRVNDVLQRLYDEFSYSAAEKGLSLRFVSPRLRARTDPRLLEQIVRNLLANALKYTRKGKILLGCRRRGEALTIEVWDSGVGIPPDELETIFDEYHQALNNETEQERGLGLGLSIVRRLCVLLGHKIQVHSRPGKGSVFSVYVARSIDDPHEEWPASEEVMQLPAASPLRGTILVVGGDQKLRGLIEIALRDEDHLVYTSDGAANAVELVSSGMVAPTLLLVDDNLSHDKSGLDVVRQFRAILGHIPAVVLAGGVTGEALRRLSAEDCLHMAKPAGLGDLLKAVQVLLRSSSTSFETRPREEPRSRPSEEATIFIVDDDHMTREALREILQAEGHSVRAFNDGEAFLAAFHDGQAGCLVMDVNLPGMNGLAVLQALREKGVNMPIIIITGAGDVAMAVHAMKEGAADFIEKPIAPSDLLTSIAQALERNRDMSKRGLWQRQARERLEALTMRQRDILNRVLEGRSSKVIAMDLGISQRTVEAHRGAIMKRMGVSSLPALARLMMAADDDAPWA